MLPIANSTELPWWAYLAYSLIFLTAVLFVRNRDINDAQRLLENGWSARAIGLFVIALGLAAAYILAYTSIMDAIRMQRVILIHRGALSVPALVVYAGLLLLAAGRHSSRLFIVRPGERFTAFQWGIIAIGSAIALVLELGLMQFFEANGYTPHL
ncbi:hypothetical protein SAMN05444166_4473 [Singulisphaera sp. GP187]|uniref:hypothetical protein n=1 Tax=Singulisphaera sp. GP187 TaxID=1882752 RepID=UPI000926634E|nr:hypothetical protein [Singulisphaera sp. GP187]SIO40995.1 hypothetical protein SAMN05444166_4473 [Singulisphaera sp. GP187]